MLSSTDVPAASSRTRVALYSHDTCGLGHMRRNLLIARTLVEALPDAEVLLISGAREATLFPVPPRVDILTLPALFKQPDGHYRARHFSFNVRDLIRLRGRIIRAALESFRPHLLVVDNVPRGAMGELTETLTYLRQSTSTRCVLGLRDVLDHPVRVHEEWNRAGNFHTLYDHYDAIWIYGDPTVYDTATAYRFPSDLQQRVVYTGYLNRCARREGSPPEWLDALPLSRQAPLRLCAVGGGQDGARLAEAFARTRHPGETTGLIVTGPFMAPSERERLCRRYGDRVRIIPFVPEATWLYERANRVVSMGGYNTVIELVALEKHPLIVPRLRPRQEQWIRARRLQELGLVDVLHPHEATPEALGHWLHLPRRPRPAPPPLNLNGLDRLPLLTRDLLSDATAHPLNTPHHAAV